MRKEQRDSRQSIPGSRLCRVGSPLQTRRRMLAFRRSNTSAYTVVVLEKMIESS